jgi:anti-anti-sigma regulatory factor
MLGTCTAFGEIDRATASAFNADLHDAIDSSDEAFVSVDCSGVTFMDSGTVMTTAELRTEARSIA